MTRPGSDAGNGLRHREATAEGDDAAALELYCKGYVGFVRMNPRMGQVAQDELIRHSRNGANGRPILAATDGWSDARIACERNGRAAVEQILLSHFGPAAPRSSIDNPHTQTVVARQFSEYLQHHHDDVEDQLSSWIAGGVRVRQVVRS
jgi:hypothetical protein